MTAPTATRCTLTRMRKRASAAIVAGLFVAACAPPAPPAAAPEPATSVATSAASAPAPASSSSPAASADAGSAAPAPPKPSDVKLATSSATDAPPAEAVTVVVSSSGGVRSGALPTGGVFTLAVAADVEYRQLSSLLASLHDDTKAKAVYLLVRSPSASGLASIPVARIALGGSPPPPAEKQSGFSFIVLRQGIIVSAHGLRIGPGCKAVGAGITVPSEGESQDLPGLRACVERLKQSNPDLYSERVAMVAADANVDFQTLVSTIDTVRASVHEIALGVPK